MTRFSVEDLNKLIEKMSTQEPRDTLTKLNYFPSQGDFLGKVVTINEAQRWLAQFDDEDLYDAVGILRNITYFSVSDVRLMCRLALLKLLNEYPLDLNSTVFVPVGHVAKSGQLISYFFRTSTLGRNLQFSDASVISPEAIASKAVVFLDDYVGSGKQFCDWWSSSQFNTEYEGSGEQYYLSLIGTSSGLGLVMKETRVKVICLQERWDHRDFQFTHITNIDSFLKKYGSGLFVTSGIDHYLGFGECRAAIVFFYNVPNNTIPIIWSTNTNTRNQQWVPLFSRTSGIQLSPLTDINRLLDQINCGQKISTEDLVFLCELMTDLRSTVTWAEVPVRDLETLCRLISEFLWHLSGGAGLKIHLPAMAELFINIRKEIISHIAERCASMPTPSIQPLLSLFLAEGFSIDQHTIISPTIWRQLGYVLSKLSQIHRRRCIKDLLQQVASADSLLAEGAFDYCCELIKSDLSEPVFLIEHIETLAPTSDHGRYYRLALLARLDERWRTELKQFLTPDVKGRILVTFNNYGKITRQSLAEYEKHHW